MSDPESIAERSWRSALIAAVIAQLEGADPARATLMAVWHDTQETRTGDLNRLARKYLGGQEIDHRAITADQTAGMPLALRTLIRELIDEYEDQESLVARCARDADKQAVVAVGLVEEKWRNGCSDDSRPDLSGYGRLYARAQAGQAYGACG